MAGTGGARPGAGRKPKAEKYASEIERAEQWIADRLPKILKKQYALAMGVMVQTTDEETGVIDVYLKPPDRNAGQYLINRVMGKPTIRQEISFSNMSDEELIRFITTTEGEADSPGGTQEPGE